MPQTADHPIPLFAGGTAFRLLAVLDEAFPMEVHVVELARRAGCSRGTASKALSRLKEDLLVVPSQAGRGAYRAAATIERLRRSERPTPSLHAIQVGLPYLQVRGGLSPSRAQLSGGRKLTLQGGLVSVSATQNPVPITSWASLVDEVDAALGGFGVELRRDVAQLVTVELNLDYRLWRLHGVDQLKLTFSKGGWGQVYQKRFENGETAMRVEVRVSPKGVGLDEVAAQLSPRRFSRSDDAEAGAAGVAESWRTTRPFLLHEAAALLFAFDQGRLVA